MSTTYDRVWYGAVPNNIHRTPPVPYSITDLLTSVKIKNGAKVMSAVVPPAYFIRINAKNYFAGLLQFSFSGWLLRTTDTGDLATFPSALQIHPEVGSTNVKYTNLWCSARLPALQHIGTYDLPFPLLFYLLDQQRRAGRPWQLWTPKLVQWPTNYPEKFNDSYAADLFCVITTTATMPLLTPVILPHGSPDGNRGTHSMHYRQTLQELA